MIDTDIWGKAIVGMHLFMACLFVFQQLFPLEPLVIEDQGEIIAEVNHSAYILPIPGVTFVDEVKLNVLMNDLDKQVYLAPTNAVMDGGGRIIPEKPGMTLNRTIFKEQFYRYIVEGDLSRLEVPLRSVHARVDSELLQSILEKKIGSYFTYYNSNNKNRSHNIGLAAKAINNTVVFPKETFSFNEVVGKRTKEKGYLRAPIIVRGEASEDIGGGICQISSTLFNAVDRAGLEIIQRYSHSKSVPYVPPGRDATVSWYGPDFSFKNKYNQPILIRAFAHGGQVSIIICSSDMVKHTRREVPSASKRMPEEIAKDLNANHM
ncbi:VanW family protein [Paenibacillus macquariensis]|nr:VanW family protein [Paenibacillus macquariensis]MEC0089203.1 VanW family protein [Paenibacillus macquariensis]